MEKRHFELIAEALADTRRNFPSTESAIENDRIHQSYVSVMADALEDTNPRFDRDRFVKAAGSE